MAKKFVSEKAPFIRNMDEKVTTTTKMMTDVIIALLPIILFAWFKNGILPYINQFNPINSTFLPYYNQVVRVSFWEMLHPLIFIVLGGIFSVVLEGLYFLLFKYYFPNKYTTPKRTWNFKTIINEVKNSYALIPGLILALILPVNTPIYVLLFGCFFANIVFKMLYGGFGKNIFNPALIAYVIILASFWGVIANAGGSLNPIEVVTGASPLYTFNAAKEITYNNVVAPYGNLWSFFFGFVPGSMGETCSFLIIIAFVYLVIKEVISWVVPVFYVSTVFILSLIIALVNGYNDGGIFWYPIFQVISGGLLFGAVFMATEPVTTPRSPNGRAIFGVFLGIFTLLFRLVGSLTGGVATAILFVSLFGGVIDRIASKLRMHRTNYRSILGYLIIILVMVALSFYVVIKVKI